MKKLSLLVALACCSLAFTADEKAPVPRQKTATEKKKASKPENTNKIAKLDAKIAELLSDADSWINTGNLCIEALSSVADQTYLQDYFVDLEAAAICFEEATKCYDKAEKLQIELDKLTGSTSP